MMLRDHIPEADEHTWAEQEDSHCDYPSLASLHSGYGARVEVEALEAAGALDSAVDVHV